MSDSSDGSASSARSPADFERELVELCRVLEQWRAERKAAEKSNPDDFPRFNWRAAFYSACFFALYALTAVALHFFGSHVGHRGVLLIPFFMLSSVVVGILFFVVGAMGYFTRQFWRALFAEFKNKDNYPFTPLLNGLRTNFSTTDRLRPFSVHALVTVQERIALDEAALRERFTSVIGSPSLLATFGLIGVIWTAWKNFHEEMNLLTWLTLFSSIAVFILAASGFRLRLLLLELAPCRALLSLEIARRKTTQE